MENRPITCLSLVAEQIRPRANAPGCLVALLLTLSACGGGGSDTPARATTAVTPPPPTAPDALDVELRALITQHGLTGNPAAGRNLPSISDPVPQLGKLLFFSKSLGGGMDTACVSCHHPLLGGGDGLSLSIGVGAAEPDVLGPDRTHPDGLPNVPRNAQTVFNSGLWDSAMFWDSRVESLSKDPRLNGAGSGIRTPDSPLFVADINAGASLPEAQARFPVTSAEEMKTGEFEPAGDNDTVRAHLAARIGDYGAGAGELVPNNWLAEFRTAFVSALPAEQLVTFDNIAFAIGEYERSMVFVDNPWRAYVEGSNIAISNGAKRGAILFFTDVDVDGAGCHNCHSGDFFTDEEHHTVAFPNIGPGRGDGNNDDFGREHETGLLGDRYRFRTATLLNVEVTAPYTHAGAYETLNDLLRHYNGPNGQIDNYFEAGGWCQLDQFEDVPDCALLYPDSEANTGAAFNKVQRERNTLPANESLPRANINNADRRDLIDFLETLTDPCVLDPACLAPWIADPADTGPDGGQLNAVDGNGNQL